MRPFRTAALALVLAASAAPLLHAQSPAAWLAAPGRSDDDKAQDARRKPAELAAFAGVKPGDKVADMFAGGGYFTRAFAAAVGPTGKVYAVFSRPSDNATALTRNPALANIALITRPWGEFASPEPLDVVFNSQFYHDLYNPEYGGVGGAPANTKAVFAALKPGGVYLVVDHAAKPGAGVSEVATIHRIEEETAKKDIVAAGFVYEGSSPVLRNPDDARTANVTDPAIRGRTDQFVLKFRKPR